MGTQTIPPLGIKPDDDVLDALYEGIPHQPQVIAGLFTGLEVKPSAGVEARAWDWADAVDVVQLMGQVTGVDVVVRQGTHQAFHPGRTAEFALRSGEVLGHAGELHPKVSAAHDLPARTVAFEVDVDRLFDAAADIIVSRSLSTYPTATQDVALVVNAAVVAGDVLETLREGAGELLEDVSLFDVYTGPGIAEGSISLAFALRFRAPDRTLTAEEASAARDAAVALAGERFSAVQR